ncbi:DUF5134 domain-containing protein [Actinokineospora guangxiensis]|uniref:DUF5134 domain-containing protein n=1 Tax=Actinokineospora guangxiensis TaxID=1490288 RepID=A0ABW0ENB1_9PSEU
MDAPWISTAFAVAFGITAIWSAARLRLPGDRLNGLSHLLMGVGMVAMFAPALDPLPQAVWVVLFGLFGLWLVATVLRAGAPDSELAVENRGHRAHAALSTGAMAYMFLAMGAPADHGEVALAMAGPVLAHDHSAGGSTLAPVSVALAVYFLGHAAWSVRARLREPATAGPALFGPTAATACHVVMGLGMGYMFLLMAGWPM